jgi:hypothetical protein
LRFSSERFRKQNARPDFEADAGNAARTEKRVPHSCQGRTEDLDEEEVCAKAKVFANEENYAEACAAEEDYPEEACPKKIGPGKGLSRSTQGNLRNPAST